MGDLELDVARGIEKLLHAPLSHWNSSPSMQVKDHPVKENSAETPGKVILSKEPEIEVCIVWALLRKEMSLEQHYYIHLSKHD